MRSALQYAYAVLFGNASAALLCNAYTVLFSNASAVVSGNTCAVLLSYHLIKLARCYFRHVNAVLIGNAYAMVCGNVVLSHHDIHARII